MRKKASSSCATPADKRSCGSITWRPSRNRAWNFPPRPNPSPATPVTRGGSCRTDAWSNGSPAFPAAIPPPRETTWTARRSAAATPRPSPSPMSTPPSIQSIRCSRTRPSSPTCWRMTSNSTARTPSRSPKSCRSPRAPCKTRSFSPSTASEPSPSPSFRRASTPRSARTAPA